MNCPVCNTTVEITKQGREYWERRVWCPACKKRGGLRQCISCHKTYVSLLVVEPVWKDHKEVIKGQCTSDHHCNSQHETSKQGGEKSAEMLANRDYEQSKSYHRKLADGFKVMDAGDKGEPV